MKILILLIHIITIYIDNTSLGDDEKSDNPSRTCYGDLGCLETDSTWYDKKYRPKNRNPFDQFTIKTDFLIIKRNKSYNDYHDLYYTSTTSKNASIKAAGFQENKSVVFLIHDYTSNGYTGWIKHISAVLLDYEHDPYNIISIDWQHGAKPPYDQAIANARVVALEIIKFMRELQNSFHVNFEAIHVVGHGVGAHIAGYVGTVYNTISQIVGLDPSGPRFEGMPDAVKLNPSRAKYVEVLHTDAFDGYSQGTLEKMGHSDFYINSAGLQPGCKKNTVSVTRNNNLGEGTVVPGCSHKRAFKYFIEALYNNECVFLGIRCSSNDEFLKGNCTSCGNVGDQCKTFGLGGGRFNSEQHVAYYLNTRATAPFCLFQYKVTVKIGNTGKSHNGYFDMIFVDENKMVVRATLSGTIYSEFKSGKEKNLIYYAPPPVLTKLTEAKIRWNEDVKFYCVVYCKQTIKVEWVSVTTVFLHNEYNSYKTKLCLKKDRNIEIENGNYVTFTPC